MFFVSITAVFAAVATAQQYVTIFADAPPVQTSKQPAQPIQPAQSPSSAAVNVAAAGIQAADYVQDQAAAAAPVVSTVHITIAAAETPAASPTSASTAGQQQQSESRWKCIKISSLALQQYQECENKYGYADKDCLCGEGSLFKHYAKECKKECSLANIHKLSPDVLESMERCGI